MADAALAQPTPLNTWRIIRLSLICIEMAFNPVTTFVDALQARKIFETYSDEKLHHSSEAGISAPISSGDQQLSQLIRRLQTLHLQAKTESIISPTTISQGLQLWEDIDNWEGFDSGTSVDDTELGWLYKSLLFIWLHLIIHPRSIDSEKVQQLVTPRINYLKSRFSSQSPALLLLPIFFHGLGRNEEFGRQMTLEAFSTLIYDVDKRYVEICEATLKWCWENYDTGTDRSWDWTERVVP